MASFVLKNCKLYVAQYNLSGDMNQLALDYRNLVKPCTTFGNSAVRRVPGLNDVQMSGQGYYQAGDGLVDPVLFDNLGLADKVITICPTDGTAGEKGFFFKSVQAEYVPQGSIGEMFAFNISAQGSDVLARGTIMVNGALTATAAGTARQLGQVSATQKLYAAMHVVAVSGTLPTLDMVVQSDNAEGFLSAADRITFAQATAITSQYATSASGAITDDWWRLSYTITGTNPSFTVIVPVGIQ